jgi:hypothetical protein
VPVRKTIAAWAAPESAAMINPLHTTIHTGRDFELHFIAYIL